MKINVSGAHTSAHDDLFLLSVGVQPISDSAYQERMLNQDRYAYEDDSAGEDWDCRGFRAAVIAIILLACVGFWFGVAAIVRAL